MTDSPFEPIHPSPATKLVIEELEKLAEWHDRVGAPYAQRAKAGKAVEFNEAVAETHTRCAAHIRHRIKQLRDKPND